MNEKEMVEFEIQVSVLDASNEELDSDTRQLLSEVRQLDVETAELTRSETIPVGSKGDPITIGSIVISVLPAVLPSVVALVQAWVMRGKNRTVKFKGKGIEFEGSPEKFKELLEFLEKQKRKAK